MMGANLEHEARLAVVEMFMKQDRLVMFTTAWTPAYVFWSANDTFDVLFLFLSLQIPIKGIDDTLYFAREYDRRVGVRIRAQNPKHRRFPDLESGAHGIDCFLKAKPHRFLSAEIDARSDSTLRIRP